MFNQFVLKKWAALATCAFLPTIGYNIGYGYYGLIGGLGFFFGGALLGCIMGIVFLKNPFTTMLEGKGLIAMNIDSTGILTPFVMNVNTPYIKGKVRGKTVKDIFNRKSVFSIGTPIVSKYPAINDVGKNVVPDKIPEIGDEIEEYKNYLHIRLDKDAYNNSKFGFLHYPLIMYNSQTKSVITKDWLSDKENEVYAEHTVLLLNRKMDELTQVTRDFARHVIESLKPIKKFAGSWITWLIIVAVVIVLLVLFGPSILQAIRGDVVSSATGAVSNVVQTPIG